MGQNSRFWYFPFEAFSHFGIEGAYRPLCISKISDLLPHFTFEAFPRRAYPVLLKQACLTLIMKP